MSDFPLEALILLQTLKKYKFSIAFQNVNKNKNPSITLAVIAVLLVTRFGTKVLFIGAHFHPTFGGAQSAIISVMITMLPKGVPVLTELQ